MEKTKLTEEQVSKLNAYRDIGLKAGLSTTNLPDDEVKSIDVQTQILGQPATVIMDSPYAAVQREQVGNFVWPYLDGHFSANYYYDFLRDIVTGYPAEYDVYRRTLDVGLMYPLKNVCIVSRTVISRVNEVLHREDGPAILYPDG